MDLVALLRLIKMRWKMVLAVTLLFMLITLLVLLSITPLYPSSALVVLDSRKNSIQDLSHVLSGLSDNETTVRNQVAILTSRDLAERVILQLGLDKDPEFNLSNKPTLLSQIPLVGGWLATQTDTSAIASAERAQLEKDGIIDQFLDRVSAAPLPSSSAIKVTFLASDPVKASLICNAITKAYVDDQIASKLEASQKATQWLTDRIEELANQLQSSDAAVQQYRADNNITETNDGNSVIEQQVTSINAQLVVARADLAEKQATYNRVMDLQRSGRSTDVSQVVASPLISQLRNQETEILKQRAEYSLRYGPNHPKIRDLESERKDLEQKITLEVQRVVETVGNDLTIAQAKVNSLTSSLRQVENRSTGEQKAEVKLKSLESSTDSLRALHSTLLSRLKETQNQGEIETPDARTISTASVSEHPSYPKKGLVLVVMSLAGLVLGIVLAVLLDRSGRGFRTGNEVESVTSLPMLATIPELASGRASRRKLTKLVLEDPLSAYSEAFRGLLQSLDLADSGPRSRILVVTSTVPEEGKTTVAISLARLAAQTGQRVLLVDGDLRNPSVAKGMSLTNPTHGLVPALLKTETVADCLNKDPLSEVMVLGAGKMRFKPAEVLNSARIERLFEEIRGQFDLIVVDTAPLLPVNDAKLFARLADSLLFVVRWDTTPRSAVVRVLDGLGKVSEQLAGVVLTRTDMTRFHGYSYGYGDLNYAYRKYYAE